MPQLVDCLIEDPRWTAMGFAALAERACRAALGHLGMDPNRFEISCLACNDARIAELNADFRGKPQPTNVLSWPSEERAAEREGVRPRPPGTDPAGRTELGDIAIAFGICQKEAVAAGLPLADHVAHLMVHGTLHLLGYDHERDADATLMERTETEILGNLGIPDPYRDNV